MIERPFCPPFHHPHPFSARSLQYISINGFNISILQTLYQTTLKDNYNLSYNFHTFFALIVHGPLALDALLVPKILKRHFFQGIKNSFHGVTRMGLKPHQNFFQNFFSTVMVARGVQSFCILEGATDPLIEQWLKFLRTKAGICHNFSVKWQ